MLGGVCGGLASYFSVDAVLIRLLWFVLIFARGAGLIAYIAAWIIIPEEEYAGSGSAIVQVDREGRKMHRSDTDKMLGGVCGGIADYLNVDSVVVRLLWVLFSLFAGLGVIAYIAAWIIIPKKV